jgi:hypothetical protein
MTDPQDVSTVNPIVQMFEWWNRAFTEPDGFTPDGFRQHYTDTAELIVNGQLRGTGPEAIARHYRTLQASFDLIQMELPVIDSFECGNRAFVQCVTRATRNGEVVREEAMAAATLSSGRMSLLKVLGGRRLD